MNFRVLLVRTAVIVVLGSLFGQAQTPLSGQATGSVTGRVVDAVSRRPLVDAQVSIPGAGIGTLTDTRGAFLLAGVSIGQTTVRVDLLGYGPEEMVVSVQEGQVASATFTLSPQAIAMDELVVTGLGKETERRKLPTSLDVISSAEISQAPVTSLDQLLQGRVTGATINATSAQPGTTSLINFRGVSSVVGAQTPVIYVDGVRVDNNQASSGYTGGENSSALSDILTSDIERIEVTRGGAASTLFGSDAATGVIQIFTKKGRVGAPRFTSQVEMGWDAPELKYMFDTRLSFPDRVESGEVPGNFMQRNFWQNGMAQKYYLGVDGGTDQVTFSVSGRIQNEEGVQPKNESTIYALRGGLRAQVSEDFTIDFSASFTRHSFDRLFNGYSPRDPLTSFEVGDALYFSRTSSLQDALDIFLMPDIEEVVNRFIFSSGFTWRASDAVFARLNAGVDRRENTQRVFEPIGFTPGEVTGRVGRFDRAFSSFSLDAATTLSWPRTPNLTSDLTVGIQGYRDDESRLQTSGTTFALPGAPDIDAAANITASETNTEVFSGGIYIEQMLDLFQNLTLTGGVRFDASTAFGDEVSFEAYPKAGVSYLVSSADWFPTLGGSLLNDMKVRVAYGETGKPPSPFDKDRSFTAVSFRGESSPRFDNPGNDELRPERTSTIEFGVDAAFLNDRVALDFTWYDAKTTDALFFVPEQPVSGLGSQLRNVGEIRNTGIEVALNAQLINRESLAVTLGTTYQRVDNRVTDMGISAPFFSTAQQHVCGPPNDCDPGKPGLEKLPVGSWYTTVPIDTNGDGKADASARQYTGGQPTPTESGSFNTSIRIGNSLTIGARADWAAGHQVMDWGSVWSTYNGIYRREIIRCGREADPNTCDYLFPVKHDAAGNPIRRFTQSEARSAYIYDGDWLKWREISVRYSLPDHLVSGLGAERGSIYGSIRNVGIWSKNKMIDPELSGLAPDSGDGLELGGQSSVTASPPRRFRLGLEVVF